jgi:magnesium-transporting ATPase (P-type)
MENKEQNHFLNSETEGKESEAAQGPKFWQLSNEEILSHFNQTLNGYSDSQAAELLEKHGKNELPEEEGESILEKIYEQFQDTLVRILLAAAVISFILALTSDGNEGISAYIEPLVILLILIANATIGVWQDINANKAIEALKKLQAAHSNVKRNGKISEIDSADLVPGDIIVLNEGEKVPADARILEIITSNFEIDESNLTGEPLAVFKHADVITEKELNLKDQKNIAFCSTGVTIGHATAIVVYTGKNTQLGHIGKDVQDSKENEQKSPLKIKLEEFGDYLTYIIGIICLLVWVINYKNFFDEIHGTFLNGMIYYFKISVALAVAAIPEGLPAVITTCLALGSRRMAANNAIVRKLDAIETLGCTSVICSDKTGTLTTNNMTVKNFMTVADATGKQQDYKVEGTSFNPNGLINPLEENAVNKYANLKALTLAASLCNRSTIKFDEGSGNYYIAGSPTEGAIKVLVEKFRVADNDLKEKQNKNDPQLYNNFIGQNYEVLHTLEFDRVRKTMSVIALDKKANKPVLLTKGALDFIIPKATKVLLNNGEESPLTENMKQSILETTKTYMAKSYRTLGFFIRNDLSALVKQSDLADKKYFKNLFKDTKKFAEYEKDLTFVGIVGMMDPPRPEVKNAIETCATAQIRVIMITGDDKNTAEAIGKEISLVSCHMENCSFTTNEFFKFPVDKQKDLLSQNKNFIFSRSEPNHKKQLVALLKGLGNVVAMTGDGVNDAPALAESNIGISMGITGTEVAKSASKIILADDNFASIVKAVEEGRGIYMNMKAFIRYLISSNIGEVVAIFITSFFGLPEAFTSIQLLWVKDFSFIFNHFILFKLAIRLF